MSDIRINPESEHQEELETLFEVMDTFIEVKKEFLKSDTYYRRGVRFPSKAETMMDKSKDKLHALIGKFNIGQQA